MKTSKIKKLPLSTKKTIMVTVDIGKRICYGYFRAPDNAEAKPFPFGAGSLFSVLKKVSRCRLAKQRAGEFFLSLTS